jgi:pimeloyl-ACP methyl ester carboxylesterase
MRPKLAVVAMLGLVLSIALIFLEDAGGVKIPAENPKASPGSTGISADLKSADVDDILRNQSEDHSLRWFYSAGPGELRGVCVVIHGLNLQPEKMSAVIAALTGSGVDVLRLSLRGHGDNYAHAAGVDADTARMEAFKNVSYGLWLNEAYLACSQAQKRAGEINTPLFLAAFSLGGLIGLDLFASNPEVNFDRVLLFAPAIRLRATMYLERVLAPFPRLVIPSLAPKGYLANKKGTPIAAYNALFEGLEHFEKNAGPKLNVPTLVFIDARDEFVPLGKLKKLVEEKKWNRWQFYRVEKDQSAQDDRFYHHIIDASSTGNAVWQDMMKAAVEHLLNHKSN